MLAVKGLMHLLQFALPYCLLKGKKDARNHGQHSSGGFNRQEDLIAHKLLLEKSDYCKNKCCKNVQSKRDLKFSSGIPSVVSTGQIALCILCCVVFRNNFCSEAAKRFQTEV